jgi:hypothetical protein
MPITYDIIVAKPVAVKNANDREYEPELPPPSFCPFSKDPDCMAPGEVAAGKPATGDDPARELATGETETCPGRGAGAGAGTEGFPLPVPDSGHVIDSSNYWL